MFWLLAACNGPVPDVEPVAVPWSGGLAPLAEETPSVRGRTPQRAIVHLHSPWSHDACDGEPLPDGSPDPACLDDLRHGLCETRIDAAFLTDHPAHAAEQPYADLFHARPQDTWVEVAGERVALRVACDNGHEVLWLPGIEDELMPVALDRHVADSASENDRLYNGSDAEAIGAELAAGATVLIAHTEGRDLAALEGLQDLGLGGVELFNLHASFAPDIREEDLGLDGLGWLSDIAPFTSPEGTGEPDLFFLAVLQEQTPSIARWDALLARGPMVGVAGTDAHQNVLPLELRDGERGDSYRRMLRWFSNILLVEGDGPEAVEAALAAGRMYVAFEVLGTPSGFDFWLDGDAITEMGGTSAAGGTLRVVCPTLSARSPTNLAAPEITATVFKDGQIWQTGCGEFVTDGPGVYRARVDLVPHHLRDHLGSEPDAWIRSYPWIYSNAIRVAP